MITSLLKYDPNAFIYVFAFDEKALTTLKELNIKQVKIVSLLEFETENLLSVKKERTIGEYCWTCTPFIIKYCIEKFNLPLCTYLDSDLFFFSNPDVLLRESKNYSVLITDHNYSPVYDQSKTSGKYCVQFITFTKYNESLNILNWWASKCLEWCYNRFEGNKFGDQKYLDDWLERFNNVYVIQNVGCGIAPWNIQDYTIDESKDKDVIIKKNEIDEFTLLIFYHFHEVKYSNGNLSLNTDYYIQQRAIQLIHSKYFEELQYNHKILKKYFKYCENPNFFVGLFNQIYNLKNTINTKDLLIWEKLAISNLYLSTKESKFSSILTKYIEIDSDFKIFEIIFEINSENEILEFTWMPMWRSSLEIRLESIEIHSSTENENIEIEFMNGNFQYQDQNSYTFLNNHGIFSFSSSLNKIVSVKIKGKWKLINTWESYLNISQLIIKSKKNQDNIYKKLKNYFLKNILN